MELEMHNATKLFPFILFMVCIRGIIIDKKNILKRNGIWSSAKINYNASVYAFDIGTKVSFISIVCPRVVGSVTFWWSLTKKNPYLSIKYNCER